VKKRISGGANEEESFGGSVKFQIWARIWRWRCMREDIAKEVQGGWEWKGERGRRRRHLPGEALGILCS